MRVVFATLAANKPVEITPCTFDDLQEQSLLVLKEGALMVDGPLDNRGASEKELQGVASAKECTGPLR